MVMKRIILGNAISYDGIEVDKAEIDLIANLPSPTYVKDIRLFLGNVGFYRRLISDSSKIDKPLTKLLAKDIPFHFLRSV